MRQACDRTRTNRRTIARGLAALLRCSHQNKRRRSRDFLSGGRMIGCSDTGGVMSAKFLTLAIVVVALSVGQVFAQTPAQPAQPSTGTVSSKPATPVPGNSASPSSPDEAIAPGDVKATSEVGNTGPFVGRPLGGVPSTGSDNNSPPPIPGSPPTSPR
jgi:hypothetical protein